MLVKIEKGKHYLVDHKKVEDALKVKSYQLQFIQHNQEQNVNLETLVEQFLFALNTTKYLFVSAASMYAFIRVYID